MPSATFPTWTECLEEFSVGMREQRDSRRHEIHSALPVSAFLRKPTVSYAEFVAGREQRDAN